MATYVLLMRNDVHRNIIDYLWRTLVDHVSFLGSSRYIFSFWRPVITFLLRLIKLICLVSKCINTYKL